MWEQILKSQNLNRLSTSFSSLDKDGAHGPQLPLSLINSDKRLMRSFGLLLRSDQSSIWHKQCVSAFCAAPGDGWVIPQ